MKRADLDIPDRERRYPPALLSPAEPRLGPGAGPALQAAVAPARVRVGWVEWTRLPPVWFAITLASMLALHFALPLVQWNLGMSRFAGLPCVVAGLALVLGGVRGFASRTTLHPFHEASELVSSGCFARSRNPMYAGLVLSLSGGAIMLGSLSPLLCIPPFAWLLQRRFIAHEERALEARFGDAYRDYRRRVRRWL